MSAHKSDNSKSKDEKSVVTRPANRTPKARGVDEKHKSVPKHIRPLKAAFVDSAVQQCYSLNRERIAIKSAFDAFEKKYVAVSASGAVGENPFSDKLKLKDLQIAEVRSMVRSTLGTTPIKIKLYEKFGTNVSAGTLVNTFVVDPSAITEFVALASLFDEFRVVGGKYHYAFMGYINNSTTGLDNALIVCYDPADLTNLTSIVTGLQKQQHQLYFATILVTSLTNPVVRSESQVFEYHIPKGVVVTQSAGPAGVASSWQATNVAALPYGFIKMWGQNLAPNASSGLTGWLEHVVEFRCRE